MIRRTAATLAALLVIACGGSDGTGLIPGDDGGSPSPDATVGQDAGKDAAHPHGDGSHPDSAGADAPNPPPPFEGGTDAPPPPPPPPQDSGACTGQPVHSGGLTQYDQTALGNCGMPWPSNNLYAALSTPDYESPSPSGSCGKCLRITGPTGWTAVVQAVDQCPTSSNPLCVTGHLDLSHAAFAAVVPPNYPYGGEVPNNMPVNWQYVPCAVGGPIVYHFKDGVNPGWIAVQIRNSVNGIQTVRYQNGSSWTDMQPRTDGLAYFVVTGLNTSSINLEAVDEYGHVLDDYGLNVAANSDVQGHAQFPSCP